MQQTHKVIVIEDDESIRQMYKFKLQNSGFEVFEAKNGQIGLNLAEEIQPDLILLDLMMPIMNGDEMLQLLREKDWGANIRVIVLTNISKNEAPHVLRLLNVDRYVVKAHNTPSQVMEIVDEVLGKRGLKIV